MQRVRLLINNDRHKKRYRGYTEDHEVGRAEQHRLVVVVKTASDNHQFRIGCPIHQSVRVIDAPGPVAG